MKNKRIVFNTAEDVAAVLIPVENCGLTLEQIIAKDVPKGVDFDVVDVAEIPTDRTYRDAWKHEKGAAKGQKIKIDAVKKTKIDADKIAAEKLK